MWCKDERCRDELSPNEVSLNILTGIIYPLDFKTLVQIIPDWCVPTLASTRQRAINHNSHSIRWDYPAVPYAWPPAPSYGLDLAYPNMALGLPGYIVQGRIVRRTKIHGIGNSRQSFQRHFDQGHIVPSPDKLCGAKEPKTTIHLLYKTIYTKDDPPPALQDYLYQRRPNTCFTRLSIPKTTLHHALHN